MEMKNIYVPEIAEIVRAEKMTAIETFFEVRLPGRKGLGHQPGQFVQVSLFGIGEAPISICSSPLQKGTFEMVVRRVGNVTEALHGLPRGTRWGSGPVRQGILHGRAAGQGRAVRGRRASGFRRCAR